MLESLRRWFGVPFAVWTSRQQRVQSDGDGQSDPCLHWNGAGDLCCQVAGTSPRLIFECQPLWMLAVPLDVDHVALASFVQHVPRDVDEVVEAARTIGVSPQALFDWAQEQTPWQPEALERMAALACEKFVDEARIEHLESEVDDLSLHLGNTYEEISLIYRLTQNLSISKGELELCEMALDWLIEIMPIEAIAVQVLAPGHAQGLEEAMLAGEVARPALLSRGECPIRDERKFLQFLRGLSDQASLRPVVVNKFAAEDSLVPKNVRQMILAPLREGSNLFGYLVAFNHIANQEFGSSEADLLSSVTAILGIHRGNTELYRQQAELSANLVRALTSAIDAKDPYTCGHSDRVARVAVRIAQQHGCSQEVVDTIYLSGLLHDVGKIGIDDQVLRKPGRLTPAEFEHIKQHPQIGYNILSDVPQLKPALPVVLHHHESWDGSGYPHGLKGEEIPLLARIVAVADAFDAMGSDRPYRKGMPDEKLDQVIREGAGVQWDPDLVAAFFAARDAIRECVAHDHEDDPAVDLARCF